MFSLKSVFISTACSLILAGFMLSFLPQLDVRSVGVGFLLSLCNFYVILWAWSRIFIKKTIALASGVIVFKYAILGLIIYKVTTDGSTHGLSLLVGLSFIIVLISTFGVVNSRDKSLGAS